MLAIRRGSVNAAESHGESRPLKKISGVTRLTRITPPLKETELLAGT
jgi:hypothetical protein